MSEAEYGLIKSFHIDDGELDGQSPQECFVLGYELGEIDQQLASGVAIARPVHAENTTRIAESCRKAGREFSLSWMAGDVSESWLQLTVEAKE